ncbi:MAG: hypothetical protein EZS28_041193 [Streblomastix strix]|uniref:Uncharacterized protein n=1 Tax=Streblomastix strix TaxID=222440 RepID=A0A5J4TZ22_9EUKA|nr:MAG: hypothetical protein EZS28_041193 [Streblomastix strix]
MRRSSSTDETDTYGQAEGCCLNYSGLLVGVIQINRLEPLLYQLKQFQEQMQLRKACHGSEDSEDRNENKGKMQMEQIELEAYNMRVKIENSVAALNTQSGAAAIPLVKLTDRIIQEDEALNIQISAKHVPVIDNTVADSLFRLETSGDCMINPEILADALDQFKNQSFNRRFRQPKKQIMQKILFHNRRPVGCKARWPIISMEQRSFSKTILQFR